MGSVLADPESPLLELAHRLLLGMMEVLVPFWFFAVGSCVGSFLNVVIYRLPRGEGLVHPGSRCPACQTPILAVDNIPIVGWLRLRGRCRACGSAISLRYPLVEFLVGVMFLLIGVVEILAGGVNPPGFPAASYQGVYGVVLATRWDLVGLCAFHWSLVSFLVAIAGMSWDGHSPPRRLFLLGVLLGLAAPTIWPTLRPAMLNHSALSNCLLATMIGASAGVVLNRFVGAAPARRSGAWISLAMSGAYLGWPAIGWISVLAAWLTVLAGAIVKTWARRGQLLACVPIVSTLVALLTWRKIDSIVANGRVWSLSWMLALFIAGAGLSWWFRGRETT